MEFVVIPHRESKDVFILGGTDDIQVLLDDSQVNISTIAGSRHVGPIKPRVEEWSKQLALFSETLVCSNNFPLILTIMMLLYLIRMNGWSVRETGYTLRVYLVLLIFKGNFQMKQKCLLKLTSHGKI